MVQFRVERQALQVLGTPQSFTAVTRLRPLVLAAPPPPKPDIRVTRVVQYVLADPVMTALAGRAGDSLALDDQATAELVHGGGTYEQTCDQALNLSDEAACINLGQGVSDALTLSDFAGVVRVPLVVTTYDVEASDTLALADTVRTAYCRYYAASDLLAPSDIATGSTTKPVRDSLSLTDVVLVERGWQRWASNSLAATLSDTASATKVIHRNVAQRLRLSDEAIGTYPHVILVTDALSQRRWSVDPLTGEVTAYDVGLSDQADPSVECESTPVSRLALCDQATVEVVRSTDINLAVTDTLALSDQTQWGFAWGAASILALGDVADVAVERSPVVSRLSLSDQAAVTVIRQVAAESNLDLGESVAFVVPDNLTLWTYHPFVGRGAAGNPPPPPTICPTPVAGIGKCRLVDFDNHAVYVELRSPEFGNKDRLQFNRISRETRGGKLIVFADPVWPKVHTQVLTVSGLRYEQAQAYLAFVDAHLGLEVGFVDWEGFYWKGVITNPNDAAVEDGRDMFTISFEFECEPATWVP